MASRGDFEPDSHWADNHAIPRDQILAEQVKQLYALAPIGFIATFLNALLVFFVMKERIFYGELLLWLCTVLFLTLLRVALVVRFRNAKQRYSSATWANLFILSLVLIGAAWGSIGAFSFTNLTLAHDVFLAFVLGGMAAGASSTFSPLKACFPAFAIPSLAPLVVHFFLLRSSFHVAMGAMLTLFGMLLWKIALHNYSVNKASLFLRYENIEMIKTLREAKDRVEGLNRQLMVEIEAKHHAEADLKMHHEQLERVVEERTADLLAVNSELEQFAYIASHDLKEPLRMVSSYLQLLEKKYRGQLDQKAEMYIQFAVDGAQRMQRLIDALLSYSRLAREMELTQVNVNVVFAEAIANLAPAISETNAEVIKDDLPTVNADAIQLQQLLQNLISNALKYHKPEVRPQVHVSADAREREWIFSIRDNGIGIDPHQFDRIFHIFQRLHTQEEFTGTGIGLASCKKIVERHGGNIWVESIPGEGSNFYFTIPKKEPSHPI